MSKFKVGDEVKVVHVNSDHPDDIAELGLVGEIIEVRAVSAYPYTVRLYEPKTHAQNLFKDIELELHDNLFAAP